MQDDGAGAGIRIPSMIISRRDGQKLLEYIIKEQKKELEEKRKQEKENEEEDNENGDGEDKPKKTKISEAVKDYKEGTLKFLATFNMTAPDNHVEYMIWMSSSNNKALDFIEDFRQYETRFGDKVTMTPHYNFWACKGDCEKKFTDKHCFGGGKYCAADTNHKTLSGKDIIMEDLREICIYQMAYKEQSTRHLWWDYITQVHDQCYGAVNERCSQLAHDIVGIKYYETEKCVKDSFSQSEVDSDNWKSRSVINTLIENEIETYK